MANSTSSGRGFLSLNLTQAFGAANDNILKQILIFGMAEGGIWAKEIGEGGQAVASLCLAIPFVVFSGFAGQFSDRFSKRDVSVVVKLFEIVVALVAIVGLLSTNLWVVLASMILIATQSAFFGPAKFGILPEIVETSKLSRANGTINMFTYLAAILGAAVGGPLYDAYAPDAVKFPNAQAHLWLPGLVVLVVGIAGTAVSFGIPRRPAANPTLPIRPVLLRPYYESLCEIWGSALGQVLLAWSCFYFIVAGVAILILPDYKDLLGITATEASGLTVILAVAIGVGDFVAGRASGHAVRPGLIPIGAIGTTVMFFILGVIPANYLLVAVCLAITGFLAGFFMVPLQTMTQTLSTEEQRGRILGLWNCLSFVSVILGNVLFLILKKMGMPSNQVFLVCGLLGLVCTALYYFKWKPVFEHAVRTTPDTHLDLSAPDVAV